MSSSSSSSERNERVRRAVGRISPALSLRGFTNKVTFPLRAPSVPGGVEAPKPRRHTGADFDTQWARSPAARWARAAIVEGPMRLMVKVAAAPQRDGLDRLADLQNRESVPAVIFVANHHSHLDTPLLITSIPSPWRHKLVVGAAADYFFTTRVTGTVSALALNAFPVDRAAVGRRSTDLAASLIDEGWSLIIYPEGGRSPDGWAQSFHRGAAFLANKCQVPVVPVHLEGTGQIFGKGMSRPKPGTTVVTFGVPLELGPDDEARRFNERIERAVWELGDESSTDWWQARQRAAAGATPKLTWPQHSTWRRAWELGERRAVGRAGQRRRQKRVWPKLD
jgi:1-acyl-sn-glycerol-3-phosphate acyltransferase